ncbi:uncharacterized protein LOC114752466 [Neltuma alba]|uniref:uncharacterized protein LOC114752466 n=1 Tax=Neltuma alba TaxID=207710 RepID=UPI0010A32C11|nr:uncharacterized protein LOC114752466 [Prosopis alba]
MDGWDDEISSPTRKNAISYRDILKPKNKTEEQKNRVKDQEEPWDRNLLYYEDEELTKGVKIVDTEKGPQIEFLEEEKRRLAKKWENTLIIKLLGGSTGFMQLQRKVQLMWGKAGKVELNVIGNGYMTATFQDLDDYYLALEGGSWLIQNHYLTVQTWKSNFKVRNEKIQKVTVWVRLPGLLGDYYDRKFFYNLGNKIGTAIKVDEMTLTRARTMYARMCVEVDLNAPLLPSYSVDGNELKIEYECLQQICFFCGKFGHSSEHCPLKKQPEQSEANQNERQNEQDGEINRRHGTTGEKPATVYGGWMVVQNSRRGRRNLTTDRKAGQQQGGKTVDNDRKPLQEITNTAAVEKSGRKEDKVQEQKKANEKKKQALKEKKSSEKACATLKIDGDQKEGGTSQRLRSDSERRKQGAEKTRTPARDEKEKEREANLGQIQDQTNGPREKGARPPVETQKINIMGQLGEAQTVPKTPKGMQVEDIIMDSSLENPPVSVGPNMALEDDKPPEPMETKELMGLSEVEETFYHQAEDPESQQGVWNARGAAGSDFGHAMKDMKRRLKPSLVVLVETRCSGINAQKVIKRMGFKYQEIVEATGMSGGIWILWDDENITLRVLEKHHQFLHCEVNGLKGSEWLFTAVYASPRAAKR